VLAKNEIKEYIYAKLSFFCDMVFSLIKSLAVFVLMKHNPCGAG
jgi:hypothetical protein